MILKPDFNIKDIYALNLDKLLNMGVKALFLDLDSTIMVSKSGEFLPETLEWFETLKKDFYVAIVTNNKNKEYLKRVKKQCSFKIIENACKPWPFKITKFIKTLFMKPEEVVIVGDRPLTDILCGKFIGAKTVLVGSINKNENLPTRLVRKLERSCIRK